MSLDFSSSFHQFKIGMDKGIVHSSYEFDDFRLDAEKLMLYRSGTELSLPLKAVKVLAVLVENRGTILGKDELLEMVWDDSIVEESNLVQYVYLLRKTLGTKPDGLPYIETLRRRGYRFTAEVRFSLAGDGQFVTKSAQGSRRFGVESRGNVVALANWQYTPSVKPEDGPDVWGSPTNPLARYRIAALASIVVAMILMTATVGFYWLRQDQTAVAEVEQKVLRLTDGTNVSDATISPDGKYFAYVEIEGDRERVWLQQTGQSTRIEIVPWTERTHRLSTFSPDGQWVYFVTGLETGSGTLCRVSIFGGPQATVASAVNSYPSFSPDGRQMVFYRQNKQTGENTYVILSSDGSGTERILRSWQDKSPQFGNPAWSPDGKLIAFGAISLDEDLVGSCTLTSIDVESGATSSISDERWDTCYRIAWHPDGKGIYFIGTREDEGYTTRRDQLYYVSYPEGKSRCITSEGNRHQPNSIGVTNDGAVLALPFNRSSQIWVMDSDGDSRTAVQLTTGLADGRAGIAPLEDGRVGYIARSGAGLSVWIMGPDGSQQRQLTVTPEVVEELRAGGGDRLVFSARQGRRSHLFQINTDGSDLRQLAFGEGEEIDSSISSDGKWIVYGSTSYGPGEIRKSLVKRALDQGEPVQLRRGGCETPHFSPDDQFISCIDNDKLVILSSSDGAFIRSFPARPSNSLNVGARWTPDGRALAYIAVESDVGNLWLQPIDGSPPRKLTDFTAGAIYNFAYSRDRHRLFLARGNQIRDVVLIREEMQLKKP